MDAHSLILDFALVMVLLLTAPMICVRLRLPDIVGLILAGVLVGEYGLGLFKLDTTFELLGSVGLIYLMFLAGLEINLNEFHRYRKPSLTFGLLTFLIPQVLGALGAWWLLGFSWPESILLASMFASHTLIPFSIVQRLGLGRNRAVTTTIGGTILTDTAALLVLAVVVKGFAGGAADALGDGAVHGLAATGDGLGVLFWVRLAAGLGLLFAASLYLLPRLGYWFFRRQAPDSSEVFIFVLAAVFLTAYASELAGVEPIIGAFLAGLALSPLVPGRGVLMNRLHFVGHSLFIPFFLFSVGMRVNLRVLWTGLDGWIVAGYMVAGVTITKWAAAQLSGSLLGYSRDERGLVFGLSVNQAAATLAAVLVGTRVGLFGEAVLNGTILMILATCLIGPWFTERHGRRLAEQEKHSPSGARRESGRVLIPLASQERAEAIMDLALMIRPDRCHEPVYPIHIVPEGRGAPMRIAAAERLLAGAVARAIAANNPVVPLTRLSVNIAEGILHAATEFGASAMVIGWTSRRLNLPFARNIPEAIITQARCTILVHRPATPLNTLKRIWVAMPPLIEHHNGFANAIQLLRRIAEQAGARLHFAGTGPTLDALDSISRKRSAKAEEETFLLPAWREVTAIVQQHLEANDGLVLLSARRTQLAWQPSLERLPIDWAGRWPGNNLILVYPPLLDGPEMEGEEVDGEEDAAPATTANLPNLLFVRSNSPEMRDAIRAGLAPLFPDDTARIDAITEGLIQTGVLPLNNEMALLHVHTPHVSEAHVLVVSGGRGIELKGCSPAPKALVLLLSSADGTSEQHLHVLAAIARAVRDGTLVARVEGHAGA